MIDGSTIVKQRQLAIRRDLAECERTKLDGIVAHLPVKAA